MPGYDTESKLIERRYDDSYKILKAYQKEIKSWSAVKHDDNAGYKKFSTLLLNVKKWLLADIQAAFTLQI